MEPILKDKDTDTDTDTDTDSDASTSSETIGIFDHMRIALTGNFPGHTRASIIESIKSRGGRTSGMIRRRSTHLIASEQDYVGPNSRRIKKVVEVFKARFRGIRVVNLDWLLNSIEKDEVLDENEYSPDPKERALYFAHKARYRARIAKDPVERAKYQAEWNQLCASLDEANSVHATPVETDVAEINETKKRTRNGMVKESNKAKYYNLNVPIDHGLSLDHNLRVHISSDGTIYDVTLNQTNRIKKPEIENPKIKKPKIKKPKIQKQNNTNNSFYRIQLLENEGTGEFQTWTRWGTVGQHGTGEWLCFGTLAEAIHKFEETFEEQTGLTWEDRLNPPVEKKYAFVERKYETESDDDDDDLPGTSGRKAPKVSKGSRFKREKIESNLSPEVKSLMELIFDKIYFGNNLLQMSYDVDRLPIGKVSQQTLKRGFEALKELAELIANPALANEVHDMSFNDAVKKFSNSYYSYIPHDFGWRGLTMMIREENLLKEELVLLESLTDMEIANDIRNEARKEMEEAEEAEEAVHPLDRQYAKLGMEEMTPLDPKSTEYEELADYLVKPDYFIKSHTRDHWFNFKVESIFRIERSGEGDRFSKSPYGKLNGDRRLLWYGSRTPNFGGILSQGLRIPPPEAPLRGYTFGKGVYLTDISFEPANYCFPHYSRGKGLLLLCEAELGKSMLELTKGDYNAGEEAKKKGHHATWGKGKTVPTGWKDAGCVHENLKGVQMPDVSCPPGDSGVANACLPYNEYVCYSVEPIRLRYLFRVNMAAT